MPLSIRNPRAEALARELAARTGENMTEAITRALEERRAREGPAGLVDDILAISEACSRLPDLDPRSADELLDYDENGTLG